MHQSGRRERPRRHLGGARLRHPVRHPRRLHRDSDDGRHPGAARQHGGQRGARAAARGRWSAVRGPVFARVSGRFGSKARIRLRARTSRMGIDPATADHVVDAVDQQIEVAGARVERIISAAEETSEPLAAEERAAIVEKLRGRDGRDRAGRRASGNGHRSKRGLAGTPRRPGAGHATLRGRGTRCIHERRLSGESPPGTARGERRIEPCCQLSHGLLLGRAPPTIELEERHRPPPCTRCSPRSFTSAGLRSPLRWSSASSISGFSLRVRRRTEHTIIPPIQDQRLAHSLRGRLRRLGDFSYRSFCGLRWCEASGESAAAGRALPATERARPEAGTSST